MSVFKSFAAALSRTYAAIFRQHVSVRVAKKGVRVVLQDRPTTPGKQQPPSRAELAARKELQDFRLMRLQLAELLDDLPETRATLRHLVFVERALERKGLRALQKLPLDVLQRALEQLEGVVVNWSPVGLALLRSRMAVAIIDRDHQVSGAESEAERYKTSAVHEELPDSQFEEGVEVRTDDDALAAAYAALGDLAPAAVEIQGDLGTASKRPLASGAPTGGASEPSEIRIHALHS